MSYIFRDASLGFSHSLDKNPSAESFDLHVHDKYEILCFVSGNAKYLVEGHEYTLTPGCIMLMRPAETHRLALKGKSPYERYVLSFRAEDLRAIGEVEQLLRPFSERGLGEKNRYVAGELSGIDSLAFFKKMKEECEVLSPRTAIISNLACLLGALNCAFLKKDSGEGEKVHSDAGTQMLSYINRNLCGDVSLESVSRHVHMSPSQVNRIFKKMTGTSVYDYIISKRFVMVQELIAGGEGVMAASQRCGFSDYSSFYRLYKKRTGHAPSKPH